eukprot:3092340-Prymnesium_polylepis.1
MRRCARQLELPAHLCSRAAACGDSAAGAENGGHSQGRASCPTATGFSRLHVHWTAPCSRSLAGLRRRLRASPTQ